MRRVQRSEVVDYATWTDQRPQALPAILEQKRVRRVHVGDDLTFLFETTDTIRYQIQEMMRVERIVRDAEIQHEIDTYNEVLGDEGGLGCTLMIEIDDPDERQVKLTAWRDLSAHLYVEVRGGERVYAQFDPRQVGDDRLSSVQYLKFDTQGRPPVGLGADHPELTTYAPLSAEQAAALAADVA